jgi:hypothetical protein
MRILFRLTKAKYKNDHLVCRNTILVALFVVFPHFITHWRLTLMEIDSLSDI